MALPPPPLASVQAWSGAKQVEPPFLSVALAPGSPPYPPRDSLVVTSHGMCLGLPGTKLVSPTRGCAPGCANPILPCLWHCQLQSRRVFNSLCTEPRAQPGPVLQGWQACRVTPRQVLPLSCRNATSLCLTHPDKSPPIYNLLLSWQ